ncbi:flavin reductase family protein [Streptomyces sp. NPDC057702]|uniref:flavin reductase family protein n=1 Tax=unclassified Streptomyces TaxID=2593676 RepID=UPI0036C76455
MIDGTRAADAAAFREAMSLFPSGVVIVTTRGPNGLPRGFTASSFCSVSTDPPLVLVCLANSAESHEAFSHCAEFAVSVLGPQHQAVAERFATRGADKFRGDDLTLTPDRLHTVTGALSVLRCRAYDRHLAGDHTILVGRVTQVDLGRGTPLVYVRRSFHSLADTPAPGR